MARTKKPGPVYARNLDLCGVIYVRVSKNDLHDGHGTNAQIARLEALAQIDGIPIRAVFVDDGKSAWRRKGKRPGFAQMLDALPQGVTHLYVWHTDRVTRQNDQLPALLDMLEKRDIKVHTSIAGRFDLSSAGDRQNIRNQISWAEYESDVKSERCRLSHDTIAKEGRASGGRATYGFLPADPLTKRKANMVVDPAQAAIIREIADRLMRGETTSAIGKDLNRRNVPTARGGTWQPITIRAMMMSVRLAGLREHVITDRHGEPTGEVKVYPAQWDAILTMEEHTILNSILASGTSSGNRGKKRRLLSGIAKCDLCGSPLRSMVRGVASNPDRHVYYCQPRVGSDACGKIVIDGPALERSIVGLMWEWVDAPRLEMQDIDTSSADWARDELAALDEREAHSAAQWANGELRPAVWDAMVAQFAARREELGAQLAETMVITNRVDLLDWDLARKGWDKLDSETQRVYIKAAVGEFGITSASQRGGHVADDAVRIDSRIVFPESAKVAID